MIRLLIFDPAWRRILPALGSLEPRLEPILVGEDKHLRRQDAILAAAKADADIAWLSSDLFEAGAAPAFMAAALASPGLAWMHSAAAGFDNPVFRRIVQKGARLTTSHGHAVGMAEYVLWGVLDHFQRGGERRAAQAEGRWRRLRFRELMGSTWIIYGFGAVGQAVADRARAFGARIIGVRRDPAAHALADEILAPERISERLGEADVVVLCAPLSAATRHLADAGFFAAMKAESVLVNVGRGALVDETALLEALGHGAPGHAVLDVFETEPLPPQSPLWSHPNVSLTGHASAITDSQEARLDGGFINNLERYLSGRPLLDEPARSDVLAEPA